MQARLHVAPSFRRRAISHLALIVALSCAWGYATTCSAVILKAAVYSISAPYDSRLLTFDTANPGTIIDSVTLTGGNPGSTLGAVDQFVIGGIDIRHSTGVMYGVGVRSGHAQRLYTINPTSGAVSSVPTNAFLSGSSFGFEFDPVNDNVRLTSDSSATTNYVINPGIGNVTQHANLNYVVGDPHFGTSPRIASVAFTNDFPGGTSPTLYGIDRNLETLVRIGSVGGSPNSPNTGALTTIGSLNLPPATSLSGAIALEILPDGRAFAALQQSGSPTGHSSLYSIDLATGAATNLGLILANGQYVYSLLYVPEPAGLPTMAWSFASWVVLCRSRRRRPSAALV